MLNKLLNIGFLTGSRAFGNNRPDSDYDVVFQIQDIDKINEIINGKAQTQSYYFSGFTINDDNKNINLIPVHPHEYKCWYLATEAMKATLKESGITNKIKIHSIFLGIVCLFKGNVEELSTLSRYIDVNSKLGKIN